MLDCGGARSNEKAAGLIPAAFSFIQFSISSADRLEHAEMNQARPTGPARTLTASATAASVERLV